MTLFIIIVEVVDIYSPTNLIKIAFLIGEVQSLLQQCHCQN